MLCGWEGKRRPTVMSMGSLYSPFVLVIIIWCKLCLWPGNNFKFTLTYDPRAWPLRLWLLPLALTLNDLKKITVELFNKSLLEPKKMTLYVVCRMLHFGTLSRLLLYITRVGINHSMTLGFSGGCFQALPHLLHLFLMCIVTGPSNGPVLYCFARWRLSLSVTAGWVADTPRRASRVTSR